MRKMKYKIPEGVTLEILDGDAERRDRQDSAFYTWNDSNDVALLTYNDKEYLITCVGEMRVIYNDQIIRYCDDLIGAGIKNDKDLQKIEDSGGEWVNDRQAGEYTMEVYHSVQDAIESVASWITEEAEANA
jgi:protein associated with RNAse G/E